MIRRAALHRGALILDVGGGASTFAADLRAEGLDNLVVVVDLAAAALRHARHRPGPTAGAPEYVVGDALAVPVASRCAGLWHDRAVFHFLTDPADRERYLAEVRRVVQPGGLVLVATFAPDGPERCSGLPVVRYDPGELQRVFGRDFSLVESGREIHQTPAGGKQAFTYGLLRYEPQG
ncbi:MAG: methyltransferase domain-containing protein [Gemmatimonadales bacterium]|nr:MAG: methyltransferase domain-containing protein [Gemmatimonadales bacterium]